MSDRAPPPTATAAASAEELDQAARIEACAAAQSVLLEAPAGSGKTAVLTRRFLTLLARVDDPGEILAITFTRKAAAEMRARVVGALRGEAPPEDPQASELSALARQALARGDARGWRIDREPQTLRIQTIDSFNFWLASQLPIASGSGGALTVTEVPGELYRHAARRALLAADSDPQLAADAHLLFERHDNNWMYLERLIAQMLRERGHWLRFVAGSDTQRLCAEVNASLATLARARLAALAALIPEPLRRRAASLPGIGTLGTEPADLARWKELARLLLVREDWRVQLGAHRLGPDFADASVGRELRELIDTLRGLAGAREALLGLCRAPTAALSEEEMAAIRALSRVLSRAAAELHGEFAAAGRVDYTYVAGAAREALTAEGQPTDLALRTGLALRHILVDEFQDTSLAQFQLLVALTAGWEEGDGRTLFVVGDPMQSIYRFRDAEVGLFLRARSAGIGALRLRPLRLSRNFRADPALVEFANELFAGTFPPRDDAQVGAVSYRQSTPARSASAPPDSTVFSPVTLRLFPAGERASEAGAIAKRAAELHASDPRASIAVLVVAHAHAVPVIAALEDSGVAALGVDLVPLRERMIVRDLVQLTRALFDPADRRAWLAVLRAPWCGARLATLTALSAPDDRELVLEALGNAARLARCDVLDVPRLERVRDVLTAALAARPFASPPDWVETTWMRLGGPDACSAAELADARAFLAALAARSAAGEWRGPEDLPALLENLHSATDAGENPVQVMTIHRAKGLEFDHVIVPALDRPTRSGDRRLLRWIDLPADGQESDLLIAPAAAVEADKPTDIDTYVGGLLRARELHERGRLLYVAATRARHTLWLSGAPAVGGDGLAKPDPRSLLATLWPVLGTRFDYAPPAPRAALRVTAPPLVRLRADWQPAELPPAVPLMRLPPAYLANEPEFSWVGETQRHIGTVVHAGLARLAHAPSLPSPESLGEQRAAIAAQLARLGVPERERAGAVEMIVTALRCTLADERGRWILDGAHREAHSEWPLSGVSAGRLRNVVIDRSFIDAGGTRWVIDYKTSRHEGGDLDGFLAQELERYRPQLADYRALAARLGPEPVRAALYFPLIGAFRELT